LDEQGRRVRQEDPFRTRMADIALVPERLVLERGLRVAAQESSETGDPLGEDRVALVGQRARALLPALERLLYLADLGVLQVADLRRDALQAPTEDRDRRQQRRMAVALHDLGAHRVHVQAERREPVGFDVRVEVAVRADRPGDLARADLVDSRRESLAASIDLERPPRGTHAASSPL